MELAGERRIAVPRRAVWDALRDVAAWRASLPGCDGLEDVGGHRMVGSGRVAFGPVSARFAGTVVLTEIEAPNRYRFLAEGQAGAAGTVKVVGQVVLTGDGGETLLRYQMEIGFGGMLARLGAPAVEAVVRRGADGFFARLGEAARVRCAAEAVPVREPDASPSRLGPARSDPLWSDASRSGPSWSGPLPLGPSPSDPSRSGPVRVMGPLSLPAVGWMGVGLLARFMVLTWDGMTRVGPGRDRGR